jgi:hypothetical protein
MSGTVVGVPAPQTSSGSDAARAARADAHANDWHIGALEAPLKRPGAPPARSACARCCSGGCGRGAVRTR